MTIFIVADTDVHMDADLEEFSLVARHPTCICLRLFLSRRAAGFIILCLKRKDSAAIYTRSDATVD